MDDLKKNLRELQTAKAAETTVRNFIKDYLDIESQILAADEKKRFKISQNFVIFCKNTFRKLVSEVGKNLKIDITGLKSNNEKDLESELERLKNSVRVKEDEIETKIICNICQEQVQLKVIFQKRCH